MMISGITVFSLFSVLPDILQNEQSNYPSNLSRYAEVMKKIRETKINKLKRRALY